MGSQQVAVVVLVLIAGVMSMDYDYNIYTGDSFEAFCGNDTHKQMEIVYRGDAMVVYIPDRPSCTFIEVEPAEFEVHNAFANPLCYPNQQDGMQIYSLEVIIQKSNIHQYDDPVYMVTCSYELKASGSTSLDADTSGGGPKKIPMYVSAVNATSQSTFVIAVRDVHNKPITKIRIGAFMQLLVFMTPGGDETSFRVMKCFAFSNSTGIYMEYNFLVDGCGDGDVIKKDRGFLTQEMTSDEGRPMRVAKSVFFRAFSLGGSSGLAFDCEYVITKDTTADGPSCAAAPAAALGKKRRRKKRSPDHLFERSSVLQMSNVVSDWIKLLPRLANQEGVLTYSLRREDNKGDRVGQTQSEPFMPNMPNVPNMPNASPSSRKLAQTTTPDTLTLMMAFLKSLQHSVAAGSHQQQAQEEARQTLEEILQQPLVICLIVACVLFFTTPITVVIMVHQFQRSGWPEARVTSYKRIPYQGLPYRQASATPVGEGS